ncbi:hypothetical protein BX600DRAFT_435109 [Xylariales sp. PMI_506]|nr:hypothetical protein BX600DRAFT_435109 [Xylariales sp. PMI_506]
MVPLRRSNTFLPSPSGNSTYRESKIYRCNVGHHSFSFPSVATYYCRTHQTTILVVTVTMKFTLAMLLGAAATLVAAEDYICSCSKGATPICDILGKNWDVTEAPAGNKGCIHKNGVATDEFRKYCKSSGGTTMCSVVQYRVIGEI